MGLALGQGTGFVQDDGVNGVEGFQGFGGFDQDPIFRALPGAHHAAFRSLGIDVIMLTGDNRRTADAIGRELGVSEVMAEVLPQDKERKIAELQSQAWDVNLLLNNRSRRALLTTVTLLRLIAAAANMGLSCQCSSGKNTPAARGIPNVL